MKTFQKRPEPPEELSRRLEISEQEREQLQTALEDAEQRVDRLAGENAVVQNEKLSLSSENARLRYLLAQSQARFLEARVANSRETRHRSTDFEGAVTILNEELQVSLEELKVTTEE